MGTTMASTDITTTTTTDAALLQLIWLASPALPVGGFSYSEGLESAVEAHCVHDEASAAAPSTCCAPPTTSATGTSRSNCSRTT